MLYGQPVVTTHHPCIFLWGHGKPCCWQYLIRPNGASFTHPFYPSLTPKGLSPAMSPALQRLVSRTASKYTDRALRASYTPSPARSTHLKTPAGGPQTPTSTPAPGSAARTPLSQDPASITDNLLQLPARRKASDFF